MPTYDYRCENGHTFEEFQSMLAAPVEVCPICGGKVQRLISGGTGLIFKGSGFYITDYAKKNSSPAAAHTTAKTSESTAPAKSDAKPPSKPSDKES